MPVSSPWIVWCAQPTMSLSLLNTATLVNPERLEDFGLQVKPRQPSQSSMGIALIVAVEVVDF